MGQLFNAKVTGCGSIERAIQQCPRRAILALDIEQLERSSISDILNTLKRHGHQHCLVVDRRHNHIRGLISASDVARRLHMPIKIEKVPTFVDIFRSIHRQAM